MKIAIIADSSLEQLAILMTQRSGLFAEMLSDGRIYVRVEGLSDGHMKTLLHGLEYVVSTLDDE